MQDIVLQSIYKTDTVVLHVTFFAGCVCMGSGFKEDRPDIQKMAKGSRDGAGR